MAMGNPGLLLMLPSLPLLTPYAIIAISPPTVTLLAITPSSNHFAISISQQAHFQSKCHNHWQSIATKLDYHFTNFESWKSKCGFTPINLLWLLIIMNRQRFGDDCLHHEQPVAVQPWIMFPANYVQIVTTPLFKLHECNQYIYSPPAIRTCTQAHKL